MQSHDHHQRRVSPDPTPCESDGIDNMHDIFSEPYRCAVLYYLQAADEPAAVDEVAIAVGEWRPDGDGADAEGADRLRTWLLDNHIRQMVEFGVIAYDRHRDAVRLTEDVSLSVTAPWDEEDAPVETGH